MLTLAHIQEHQDEIIRKLKKRNFDAGSLIKEIIELDDKRKKTQFKVNETQARLKNVSREIGELFKAGKNEEAENIKKETGSLKDDIKILEEQLDSITDQISGLLVQIPNVPHESVPEGQNEEDNEVVEQYGDIPVFEFMPLPHWELAGKYDLIDFELGNKITGAGFPVYKDKAARLQRGLINFFLDQAREAGYKEYLPPFVVNEDSGFGTGQLPDKEGQMYHVTQDHLYLIPTAEVPVTNFFRDVILDEAESPVKCTAYTPCFRREAGSYGKDVKGLNRLHQFDKVEIVQIEHPERSYQRLGEMLAHAVGLVKKLGLPYRVLKLCGGDMGFTSALTYDIEVYSAAQKRWLEVSSVSNFESYQANRLKLRYRAKNEKKPRLAHTLNGSALALPRILAAILENYQQAEGIRIPEVLISYVGFDVINE